MGGDAMISKEEARGMNREPARRAAKRKTEHGPSEPSTEQSGNSGQFERIAREIGALVAEKNRAYGDSFRAAADIMRALYPDGIRPEQYVDALGVVRVIDKLKRIATDRDALGESPWRDIAGYGVLGAAGAERDG